MLDQIKQLMEVKKQAEQIKKELDAMMLEVTEIDGIRIIINGSQKFQYLEIAPKLLTPENKKRVETDLLNGMNAAIKKSQELVADKMKKVTGLNIPGI